MLVRLMLLPIRQPTILPLRSTPRLAAAITNAATTTTTTFTQSRSIVHQSKEDKAQQIQDRNKEKKKKLREELKMKALDEPINHPLHMSIAEALNTIRSFEVGKPVDKSNISCNIYVRQEQGATPINCMLEVPHPVNVRTKPLVFTTQQQVIDDLSPHMNPEHIGGKDLVNKFLSQELSPSDFTHGFATSEFESQLKPLGRILGPLGLIPTKKKGTVIDDASEILNVLRAFRIRQRDGTISFVAGNCTFSDQQVMENLKAISDAIHAQIDPKAVKKTKLGYCYIRSANSPGLVIDF